MTVSAPDAHVMSTYRRWPVEIVEGRGCRVFDAQGNSYLDLVAGIAVATLGHGHPRLTSAISEQAKRLIHVSNLYVTAPQQALARALADITGGMKSFFANSGAEAVECAIKLIRRWARARGLETQRVIAADGGFHGRTLGALSATGQPSKRDVFGPLLDGFVHVPFGDLDALEQALLEPAAAVLLEPIQGEAGVVVPEAGYLSGARELCDNAGALLVLDEVQTGIGRTGSWFAYQAEGIEPDIVCAAKGLAGGLPIGVCLARPEVAAVLEPGDHGSTFGGGPVQCAAALAVLEEIDASGLLARARGAGAELQRRAASIFDEGNVRGRGLLIGVTVRGSARALAASALANGVLVNDVGTDVVRLCPPLVITDAEIAEGIAALDHAWKEAA